MNRNNGNIFDYLKNQSILWHTNPEGVSRFLKKNSVLLENPNIRKWLFDKNNKWYDRLNKKNHAIISIDWWTYNKLNGIISKTESLNDINKSKFINEFMRKADIKNIDVFLEKTEEFVGSARFKDVDFTRMHNDEIIDMAKKLWVSFESLWNTDDIADAVDWLSWNNQVPNLTQGDIIDNILDVADPETTKTKIANDLK